MPPEQFELSKSAVIKKDILTFQRAAFASNTLKS